MLERTLEDMIARKIISPALYNKKGQIKEEELKIIIQRRIIVYSNPYIKNAIEEQEKKKFSAKAIIMEPHERKRAFSSAIKTLRDHKRLTGKEGMPILITEQVRTAGKGQSFSFLGVLIDILGTPGDVAHFITEAKSKNWAFQDETKSYDGRNLLLIKTPIIKLEDAIPVTDVMNILSHNYGQPANAVSLPSPKMIINEKTFEKLTCKLKSIGYLC